MSLESKDQDLGRIADYIREYWSVDIQFDGTLSERRWDYVRLQDVPLWEALHWLTAPLNATYTVRNGTVRITDGAQ